MSISAKLTVGWPSSDAYALTARHVIEDLAWRKRLEASHLVIHCCESIFRRRAGGFVLWKEFLRRVIAGTETRDIGIECRFDVFAFAFLSSAKNADLLLPVDRDTPFAEPRFEAALRRFFEDLDALARLEGFGTTPRDAELRDRYLDARKVLARPSCRDERRVVATLFVNGPSTAVDLSEDLGISESLALRTLAMLQTHISAKRAIGGHEQFVIHPRSLAVTYFLVQETLGLSLSQPLEQYIGLHR